MDDIEVMRKALHEYDSVKKIRRINEDMLEYLSGSIHWILRYAAKNDIDLAQKDKLFDMMKTSDDYLEKMLRQIK